MLVTREHAILCFGDSNTWGYKPLSGERMRRTERWPGILQHALGADFNVIEEGLNGRTTAFDEPFRDGRNARKTLLAVLDSHAPLDLLIIMLGTNDLKHHLNVSAHESARGLIASNNRSNFNQNSPNVLVVAPPKFGNLSELMAHHFEGSVARSAELAMVYKDACAPWGCSFVDSNQVASVGEDGIHLNQQGHHQLALALAPVVKRLIGDLA
jgi:lysophospholipase L1-like esterase